MLIDIKTIKKGALVWAYTAGHWYKARVNEVRKRAKEVEVFFLTDGTTASYKEEWLGMVRVRKDGQTRADVEAELGGEEDEECHNVYDGKRSKKKKLVYKKLRHDNLKENTERAELALSRLLAARAGRHSMYEPYHDSCLLYRDHGQDPPPRQLLLIGGKR